MKVLTQMDKWKEYYMRGFPNWGEETFKKLIAAKKITQETFDAWKAEKAKK